jgi:CHAT domain-containing protein
MRLRPWIGFIGGLLLAAAQPAPAEQGDADAWRQLNQEAMRLYRAGQYDTGVAVARQALALAEANVGPGHPDVALSLNNLAALHDSQGRYAEAEPLYRRALAIREQALGPVHPDVATSLNNLALLHDNQGRHGEAEPLYRRALTIREKVFGPDHPDVAISLNNLAALHEGQGRHAEAEPLYRRALAIREQAYGPDHPDVAQSLNNLAGLVDGLGRYSEAEPLYRRALAVYEKALGPDHPEIVPSLNNLALFHHGQGRHAHAEPLYQRSLAIRERTLGPEHPAVATALNNLAGLYADQGQPALAEPLYRRALAVQEQALGRTHPAVATSLNNLAALTKGLGRHTEAEPMYRRALAIREQAFGPNHPAVAQGLNNLAGLHLAQGRQAEAEPLYRRALAILEQAFGADHPTLATLLNNLAGLADSQGRLAEAEPLYRRALAIRERALGPDHPDVAISLHNLAGLLDDRGQAVEALRHYRRASAIYRQRIVAGAGDERMALEAARNRAGLLKHLAVLAREPATGVDESFQIAQLAHATATAAAVAQMAARFAAGDDAIAGLVKRRQDAVKRRNQAESALVRAATQSPGRRIPAAEQALREELARLDREIVAVDADLAARFPAYQELTRPDPLSVAQTQAILRADEAMLVYALAGKQAWLWVVRPTKAEFLPLASGGQALAEAVKAVREEMDAVPTSGLGKVDLGRLHALYQAVFAPAEAHLAGARHVMLVPSGALQSLPFGMLVTAPPGPDYRDAAWLARRHALSVLPSVSAIRALRQFARPVAAVHPFVGFGDPLLDEAGDGLRSRSLRGLAGTGGGTGLPGIADVETVRLAGRLPESADEIRAMARIMQAGPADIWLQERATEANVRRLDLAGYRVVAFATHGVMADEIGLGMEPGLLLTPPGKGTLDDDGYLAAGEIARLRLNADWVLLSACNTAAADGTPGAEGLSGLAKAFFHAGSRALLVSHWAVASEATVALTTAMLRAYQANPGQGRAEAQRRAVQAMWAAPDHPEFAHPFYWAPFVVVGEGN